MKTHLHYDETYGKLLGGANNSIVFHDIAEDDEELGTAGTVCTNVHPRFTDLLLAAPDLLKVCKAAHSVIGSLADQIICPPSNHLRSLADSLEAAIAKAEGREVPNTTK